MADETKLYPIPVYGQSFRFIHVQDNALNATGAAEIFVKKSGDAMTGPLSQFIGTVGTQQVYQAYGWNNAISRWKTVIEPGATYAFYGYDTSGFTPTKILELSTVVSGGTDQVTVNGKLLFSGTGRRILADFSNATQLNRAAFQTSTTNGNTVLTVLPNGTGNVAAVNLFNAADPTSAQVLQVRSDPTKHVINSNHSGGGAVIPIAFQFSNVEKASIDTSGNVTASGTMTSSSTFASSGVNVVVANNGTAGGVFLRPNGAGSSTGQAVLNSLGNFTARDFMADRGDGTGVIFLNSALNRYLYYDGTIYNMPTANLQVGGRVLTSGAHFDSTSTAVVLGCAAGGTLYLRANGVDSSSGEVQLSSAGVLSQGGLEYGYRDIPRVTGGFSRGKMYAVSSGVTIGGSAAGDVYSVYNDSASAITLTQGGGVTVRLAGTATTGNRTLAARGIATLWYNSSTECIVSGPGVT